MTLRRNIVITGASSGLGEGMARQFAARGRNLALCARRLDRLDELAGQLRRDHPDIKVVTRELDVNDHDSVFSTFAAFREELPTIDRVIVNAGLGKGQPVGTGSFHANRQTMRTNVLGALAQCEAALEIFRENNAGHLVLISSVSALRGMPRNATAYAASKAAVSSLAEGIRAEMLRSPVTVSTMLPGYIESEMTASAGKAPLIAGAERGVRALVRAIERERARAYVPMLPWAPMSVLLRHAPIGLLRKLA